MADIAVSIGTATAFSANTPNTVINLTFAYTGGTVTPSKQQIYYSAKLTDNATPTANTDSVVFPFTISQAGGPIPSSEAFSYTTTKFTGDTITLVADTGKILYTA